MEILFATNNKGKIAELRELLPERKILSPADVGVHLDVIEDGATFMQNAEKKARAFLSATGIASLADDSGLCVEALSGRPGVHSARYAPTDAERIVKLLKELKGVRNRKAFFACALYLAKPDGTSLSSEGICHGEITDKAMGGQGFGYDPVFWVPSVGKTFAELSRSLKSKVSHRGVAMRSLVKDLAA